MATVKEVPKNGLADWPKLALSAAQQGFKRIRRWIGIHLIYLGLIRPYLYLLGVLLIYFKTPATFTFRGRTYRYFYHFYGLTYLHERAVEIPIILEKVQSYPNRRILEIGNVLSHFVSCRHDVVDKYEKAEGVLNEDVVDFQSNEPYDLIVSISTLEHVGWDEKPRDPKKILLAFENLRRLLASGGEIVVTLPLGYNPEMDRLLKENKIRFTEKYYLKRISRDNRWIEVGGNEVSEARYNAPFRFGNVLVVGVIKSNEDGTIA